jgi:membrane-associated phospholipid phosphatase
MWQPTVSFGGVVRPALLPGWGNVTPFGVASVAALLPPAPPALASQDYALEVNFTKDLGGTTSTARTAEQTQIARFWGYGPGTSTPPGHWNEIGLVVAEQERLDLVDSARLFALLNIALADAAIVCWRSKYDQGLWRPITAIQLDGDGNDETTADPTWTPLLPTPPFPEYTSGHSTFSGAAAAVLAEFFADDEIAFTVGSDDLPGVQRSYASFSDAAWESGISRIYGGIHWLSANVRGLECGAHIGLEVAQGKLTKL